MLCRTVRGHRITAMRLQRKESFSSVVPLPRAVASLDCSSSNDIACALCADGTVALFKILSDELRVLCNISLHHMKPVCLCVCPRGVGRAGMELPLIATGCRDGRIILFCVADQQLREITRLDGHTCAVSSLSWSDNGDTTLVR